MYTKRLYCCNIICKTRQNSIVIGNRNAQIEPERDVTKDKCGSITIYEDIMSLLGTLDNGTDML